MFLFWIFLLYRRRLQITNEEMDLWAGRSSLQLFCFQHKLPVLESGHQHLLPCANEILFRSKTPCWILYLLESLPTVSAVNIIKTEPEKQLKTKSCRWTVTGQLLEHNIPKNTTNYSMQCSRVVTLVAKKKRPPELQSSFASLLQTGASYVQVIIWSCRQKEK